MLRLCSFVKQISSFTVNFEVTVQTKQGHDSAGRDFSSTYCGRGRILGSKANTSLNPSDFLYNSISLLRLRQLTPITQ